MYFQLDFSDVIHRMAVRMAEEDADLFQTLDGEFSRPRNATTIRLGNS